MAGDLGHWTEIIEPAWQKKLHQLSGADLKYEAHRRLEVSASGAERNCADLAEAVAEIRQDDLWRQLAPTWEAFCLEFFEQPAVFVDTVVVGVALLRGEGYEGPIPAQLAQARAAENLEQAKALTIPAACALAEALGPPVHGGDRMGKEQPDNYKVAHSWGTDPVYLARRILGVDRDVFERLKQGEFRSVREAAKAAGLIKPTREPTPGELAERILDKHDRDFVVRLIECLVRTLPENVDILALFAANATAQEIRRALRNRS